MSSSYCVIANNVLMGKVVRDIFKVQFKSNKVIMEAFTTNDIEEMAGRWVYAGENCVFNRYPTGEIKNAYFSRSTQDKGSIQETHIHVWYGEDNGTYIFQLTCNKEHCGAIELVYKGDSEDEYNDYLSHFWALLEYCLKTGSCPAEDQVGGDY